MSEVFKDYIDFEKKRLWEALKSEKNKDPKKQN